MPPAMFIWALALVALGIGYRERRAERPTGGSGLPAWILLATRVPVPEPLRARGLGGPRLVMTIAATGLPPRGTAAAVAHARGAGLMVGFALVCVGAVVAPALAFVGVLVAGIGVMVPVWWIQRLARSRRRQIVGALPDLIDLVVLCVEAGVAFEAAIRMASARLPGPLAEELGVTLRQIDLGTPRREAFGALSRRMGVAELTGLVGALMQADELGTPIALTLRRQAELLRAARRQAVRAAAARAVPKVQLVVAMVMVPSALLVVLGVLVLHLFGEIGVVVGDGS